MFPLKFYCWFWGEGCPQAAQSARGASCPAALCPYPGLWPSHVTGRPGTAEHPSSRRPEGISRVVPQSPVPTGWTGGVQPHPGPTELSFPSCRAFVGSGGAQPGGAVRRLPTGFPVPAIRRLPVGQAGAASQPAHSLLGFLQPGQTCAHPADSSDSRQGGRGRAGEPLPAPGLPTPACGLGAMGLGPKGCSSRGGHQTDPVFPPLLRARGL